MNNIHRSSFEILQDTVHAALQKLGEADLKTLHAHLKGEFTPDQLRSALDGLRMSRRLTTRQDTGRTLYMPQKSVIVERPAPTPRATVHAPSPAPRPPATAKPAPPNPPPPPAKVSPPPPSAAAPRVNVVVNTNPQRAKLGSAAPASRPVPSKEGGAAPVPPAAESPGRAWRNTIRQRVLEILKDEGPQDRHKLAKRLGHDPQRISQTLSDLKAAGALKKNTEFPARWALPDQEFPPLNTLRVVEDLPTKVAVLEKLSAIVDPSIAAVLGSIRSDLTGAAA